MKKQLTFLFLIYASIACAQLRVKYDDARIIFTDGKSRTGLAETTMGDKFLFFKSAKDSEPEKIDVNTLQTIVYLKDDKKTTEVEYDRIKVYLGWNQTRISDFGWYQVVERGIATLYVKGTTMQGSIYNPQSTAGFLDYFVIRSGEPAAKMIANVSSLNNNQTFRAKAPLYFEDYAELAAKIKSKEYTWKDLVPVVQEYNKWASNKRK
jgi:hypothetical protein